MKHLLLTAGALLALVPAFARADDKADLIQKGQYLVRAADCVACHTAPGGQPFAGGRAFELPFGVLYSPNITPDPKTGIGGYTDDEWVRVLRDGVGRDGSHLYPAMPYASYSRMTREDALAIKAYMMSLAPVATEIPANRMKFPYSQRWLMVGWNLFNNPGKPLAPDASKPVEWNRGAYLVEALGHCGECHTPRNFMQGLKDAKAYAGADVEGWHAYNLTGDKDTGLGGWTEAALEQYLSTGHADGHGPASGPMAEAIENSLRFLSPGDIHAMAVYLKSLPAQQDGPPAVPAKVAAVAPNPLGAHLFVQACAGCHLPDGTGRQSAWAALGGAHSAGDVAGTNLVQILAHGSQMQTAQGQVFMHSFTGGYTDAELAAIANYTIGQFGGRAGQVTAQQIKAARGADDHKETEPPPRS
ncbi:MAG TPA: cytochrome c [Aliidongia sp.]|nr:cytochrome c [Aliidongia sp.]